MNLRKLFLLLLPLLFLGVILAGCKDGGKKYVPVNYGTWCDNATSLCWQNPNREAYNYDDIGLRSKEAVLYCEELRIGGYSDWRLPTLQEMRTIIDGYPGTEPDGSCQIGNYPMSYKEAWSSGDCGGNGQLRGPGDNGCYTVPGILGTCDKEDLYSADHYMEFFAIDRPNDADHNETGKYPQVGTVLYDTGGAIWNHSCTLGEVRCVRDDDNSTPAKCADGENASCTAGKSRKCSCGPGHRGDGYQFCADDSSCWGPCQCANYTPADEDQPECHKLVCDESDYVRLTINVPEWNSSWDEPHQLIALWYDGNDSFPQARPPEGGTWTNQVIDPGTPPYTMDVPGCTYYGENHLVGNFKLLVLLQMIKKFPQMPESTDFWWGYDQDDTVFPLSGVSHSNEQKNVTINLTSVGSCPNLCEDEYGTSYTPDVSEVWTCTYNSSMNGPGTCSDFLKSDWNETQVTDICNGYIDLRPGTLVVSDGAINPEQSCLLRKGGCGAFTRCKGVFLTEGNKTMYSFGAPETVCKAYIPDSTDNTTGVFNEHRKYCCAYEDEDVNCTTGTYDGYGEF
ncbi:DUF1566 domain-containing protein [Spirochaetota bacterium]